MESKDPIENIDDLIDEEEARFVHIRVEDREHPLNPETYFIEEDLIPVRVEKQGKSVILNVEKLEHDYVYILTTALTVRGYYQGFVMPGQAIEEDYRVRNYRAWKSKKGFIAGYVEQEGNNGFVEESRPNLLQDIKTFAFVDRERVLDLSKGKMYGIPHMQEITPPKDLKIKTGISDEVARNVLKNEGHMRNFMKHAEMLLENIVIHNARVMVYRGEKECKTEWYEIRLRRDRDIKIDIDYEWTRAELEAFIKSYEKPLYKLSQNFDTYISPELIAGMEDFRYSIDEIVAAAKKEDILIKARTIRDYQQRGILPIPPKEGEAHAGKYSTGAVIYLKYIRILQEKGLKKSEIREKFKEYGLIE